MTSLHDLSSVILFFGFLCFSNAIAQSVFQLPVQSRKETAQVQSSVFLLRDAIRSSDVSMLRTAVTRGYVKADATSGEEQG